MLIFKCPEHFWVDEVLAIKHGSTAIKLEDYLLEVDIIQDQNNQEAIEHSVFKCSISRPLNLNHEAVVDLFDKPIFFISRKL